MTSETRDGQGAGDHDVPFQFGWAAQTVAALPPFDRGRLLLMRGKVQDYRAGIRGGPADGDTGWTEERPSGLSVPITDSPASGDGK